MVIGMKSVRESSSNLVPIPSTKIHLLLLSELADQKYQCESDNFLTYQLFSFQISNEAAK